ncbi:hypothetical protein [Halovivax gelatinilyticus]|uniref:hypothetical protein n=1 Tax=Halovivax gelatinilyticus TaxID=2961597 RepID=UPI0020CA93E0|nr:hypothetical protein [Halovivax gelatinilyticus]
MSGTNERAVQVGCPRCEAQVAATVPPGPGIVADVDPDAARLQGLDTSCRNCGHEVELYYY